MILQRIREEENNVISLKNKDNKTFSRHGHPFRTTNFILRKRHTIEYHPETSPTSKPLDRSPDAKTQHKSTSPQVMEKTCSNFMKSYVEKLKKQRKREKKRLVQVNQNRQSERQSFIGCDIAPLPLIHHGKQQILIFEKMNPNSFKSAIIQPTPSSGTIQNQKIESIISQISKQKKWRGRETKANFPNLQSKAGKARQSKLKSIGDLKPWEEDAAQGFQQFK